jgi:MFS family permease
MDVLEATPKTGAPLVSRLFRRRGHLWSNREFMKLWGAQTVSLLGDQVSMLAFPLIAVLSLHASAFDTGVLTAAVWTPNLAAPLVGAWVDRHLHRREMMVAADLGRAVLVASIPVAAAFGVLTLWQLFAVAFAMGALSVLFDLAEGSYFMALVPTEHVLEAQAKISMSRSIADIGGPGLAGLLVQLLTAPFAVLADAASFVGSAAFIRRIRAKDLPVEHQPDGTWSRIREGFRYTFGNPILRASLGCAATLNFFNLMLFAIVILYATRTLGLSPGLIGLALSVAAVGALVGALVSERAGRTLGVGPAILIGSIVFPAASVLVPLAHGSHAVAVPVLIASEFLAGIGVMLFDVNIGGLMLVVTPQRLRARARGAFRSINYGVRPIGALVGGALGSLIGLRPTLYIAALGGSTAFLWLLFSPVRNIRELPGSAEE